MRTGNETLLIFELWKVSEVLEKVIRWTGLDYTESVAQIIIDESGMEDETETDNKMFLQNRMV